MKSFFCMPRLKGSSSRSRKSTRLITPMSLLDRFREAVFRLIMLSALSKATAVDENRSSSSASSGVQNRRPYYHYSYDPHHNEAVADCIEFIKKSAICDENRNSTASNSSFDASPEILMPLPVMWQTDFDAVHIFCIIISNLAACILSVVTCSLILNPTCTQR